MFEYIGIGVIALGGCIMIIICVQFAYYRFFEQLNGDNVLDRERLMTVDG